MNMWSVRLATDGVGVPLIHKGRDFPTDLRHVNEEQCDSIRQLLTAPCASLFEVGEEGLGIGQQTKSYDIAMDHP
jgi:hypothetical protein